MQYTVTLESCLIHRVMIPILSLLLYHCQAYFCFQHTVNTFVSKSVKGGQNKRSHYFCISWTLLWTENMMCFYCSCYHLLKTPHEFQTIILMQTCLVAKLNETEGLNFICTKIVINYILFELWAQINNLNSAFKKLSFPTEGWTLYLSSDRYG